MDPDPVFGYWIDAENEIVFPPFVALMLRLCEGKVWFPYLMVLAVIFAVTESGFGGRSSSSYRRISSLICC